MPINQAGMQTALLSLFEAPPSTVAECAHSWAQAVQTGTAAVVPASTTVAAAATALETQLAAAFAQPSAVVAIEAAFLAFGAAVGLGMLPAFTAVPPAGPVGFASMFTSTRDSHSEAAQDFSNAIAEWLGTGSATLVAPPNTVVPWS